jgi:isocitrate lyase
MHLLFFVFLVILWYFNCNEAMDVACLRPSKDARSTSGNAPNTSFSNQQSLKLYGLLTKLYAVGGYSHTFGALDPVQAVQMAPHLSSVYVSGWQCSSTASTTNEPGPDVSTNYNIVIVLFTEFV